MRQIKFRGKDIETGTWVYGDLFQPIGRYPEIITCEPDLKGKVRYVETAVARHTIGQYVGWEDKNEVEIYEGDVLYFTIFDHNDHDTQHKGVVTWELGTCYVECSEDEIYDLDWICQQDCEIEIISNIHDNPEILKNK